jgi:hypothetical protein
MIGIFLVFKVMKSQGNYMKEFYGSDEYKLTWMLVVASLILHVYFIYIKHSYFATLLTMSLVLVL